MRNICHIPAPARIGNVTIHERESHQFNTEQKRADSSVYTLKHYVIFNDFDFGVAMSRYHATVSIMIN